FNILSQAPKPLVYSFQAIFKDGPRQQCGDPALGEAPGYSLRRTVGPCLLALLRAGQLPLVLRPGAADQPGCLVVREPLIGQYASAVRGSLGTGVVSRFPGPAAGRFLPCRSDPIHVSTRFASVGPGSIPFPCLAAVPVILDGL